MSLALMAQNKTKFSFFLSANFFLFHRQKQKKLSEDFIPDSPPEFSPGPTGGLTARPRPPAVYKSATRSSKRSFE